MLKATKNQISAEICENLYPDLFAKDPSIDFILLQPFPPPEMTVPPAPCINIIIDVNAQDSAACSRIPTTEINFIDLDIVSMLNSAWLILQANVGLITMLSL